MKQKKLRFGQVIASLALVMAGLGLFSSCGKEKGVVPSPSYSISDFVGSYVGISTCDTGVVYFRINAGLDRTRISIPASFGTGQCMLISAVEGTIGMDSLTLDSSYYQDRCFGDYTIQGKAGYRNDSLFLRLDYTTPIESGTCYFMGRKIADTAAILAN